MGRVYDRRDWRSLPRDTCAVYELLGGECKGEIALHHIHPLSLDGPEDGIVTPCCSAHHPMLEALARRVYKAPEWKRCTHNHRYPEAREACERRLNRDHSSVAA